MKLREKIREIADVFNLSEKDLGLNVGPLGDLVDPQARELDSTLTLVDLLDRVIEKGVVVFGDLGILVTDVELITIQLRLLVSSVKRTVKAREEGTAIMTERRRQPIADQTQKRTCGRGSSKMIQKMGKPRPRSLKRPHRSPQQTSTAEPLKACYIYGIVNNGIRLNLKAKPIGHRGSKVYTIPYRDIAALVSDTEFEEYDPTEGNIFVHNEVIRNAVDELRSTVIPLRFSTIAKSEDDVVRILSAGYFDFKKKLSEFEGKVEIVVKVFCDLEGLRN